MTTKQNSALRCISCCANGSAKGWKKCRKPAARLQSQVILLYRIQNQVRVAVLDALDVEDFLYRRRQFAPVLHPHQRHAVESASNIPYAYDLRELCYLSLNLQQRLAANRDFHQRGQVEAKLLPIQIDRITPQHLLRFKPLDVLGDC